MFRHLNTEFFPTHSSSSLKYEIVFLRPSFRGIFGIQPNNALATEMSGLLSCGSSFSGGLCITGTPASSSALRMSASSENNDCHVHLSQFVIHKPPTKVVFCQFRNFISLGYILTQIYFLYQLYNCFYGVNTQFIPINIRNHLILFIQL